MLKWVTIVRRFVYLGLYLMKTYNLILYLAEESRITFLRNRNEEEFEPRGMKTENLNMYSVS